MMMMNNNDYSYEKEYEDFINNSIMNSHITSNLAVNTKISLAEAVQFEPTIGLSDLDMSCEGKFGIEWELIDGYRYWEWFNTEDDRKVALDKYEKEYKKEEKEFKERFEGRIFSTVDY